MIYLKYHWHINNTGLPEETFSKIVPILTDYAIFKCHSNNEIHFFLSYQAIVEKILYIWNKISENTKF